MEMILNLRLFKSDPEDSNSASIVPIAFSLIVGAGTMTTLISLKVEYDTINILIGVFFNLLFVYIVLKNFGWLEKVMGETGLNILHKVFGIVLLTVSTKIYKNHWML